MPSTKYPTLAFSLALAMLAFHPGAARAQPSVLFSGYGTVGVVHSDNGHADYLVDAFKPDGPGFTRAWSADVDSRIGGQVTALLAPRLSAVVQVLAKQRYDDTYTPVVEWANLKYEVTPDLSVRAGRVVLPVFMVTDSRRVGYANVWVRPPVEVYSMVPVTSSDGADASYRSTMGEVVNTFQVTAGRSNSRFPSTRDIESGEAKARRLIAGVASMEHGFATVRLTYGRASLTVDAYAALFDAFRQFGPQGAAIAERYDLKDRTVTFAGIGASYDTGAWFAMGEWAKFDTRSILGSRSSWYVSAGRRFASVTPYATYARTRSERSTSDPGLSLAGLPPSLLPIAEGLNATLSAQLVRVPVQRTVSLGVRWDFLRSAALKFQYDDVRPGAPSAGTFGQLQPQFQPGTRVRLFSAAVDFVF